MYTKEEIIDRLGSVIDTSNGLPLSETGGVKFVDID